MALHAKLTCLSTRPSEACTPTSPRVQGAPPNGSEADGRSGQRRAGPAPPPGAWEVPRHQQGPAPRSILVPRETPEGQSGYQMWIPLVHSAEHGENLSASDRGSHSYGIKANFSWRRERRAVCNYLLPVAQSVLRAWL